MEDQEFMMSNHYDWVGNFSTYDSFSSESYTENPSFNCQTQFLSSPNTFTISLGGLNNKEGILPRCDSVSYAATHTKKVSTAMIRNPIQAQDHVLAERKRREILTKRFISLSALLPNLKKMDKVSVLEDATNYIKELQERVKKLEVLLGVKRKDVQQLVMPVKILKLSSDSDTSSSSDVSNSGGNSCPYESTPEIEVRMSGSSVLVRIKCQNKSSSYVNVLKEMQKVDLSINSSSATAFSESTLLITIVAQMEDEFCITITDLVKKLQLAL